MTDNYVLFTCSKEAISAIQLLIYIMYLLYLPIVLESPCLFVIWVYIERRMETKLGGGSFDVGLRA